MTEKNLSIELDTRDGVSAVLSLPGAGEPFRNTGIAVAHGAANDMNHPMIRAFARGLAEKGFSCLRFNFPYREKQKKSVDPEHRLIHTWACALDCLEKETGCRRLIAAGKSLGARMAAQGTAQGAIRPEGLIFLGYPLHAPGRKEVLRDAPLYRIAVPMLFFEGTRDPFCDLNRFSTVFSQITAPKTLQVIENGDHGFDLPKSDPTSAEEIHRRIVSVSGDWLSGPQFT